MSVYVWENYFYILTFTISVNFRWKCYSSGFIRFLLVYIIKKKKKMLFDFALFLLIWARYPFMYSWSLLMASIMEVYWIWRVFYMWFCKMCIVLGGLCRRLQESLSICHVECIIIKGLLMYYLSKMLWKIQ